MSFKLIWKGEDIKCQVEAAAQAAAEQAGMHIKNTVKSRVPVDSGDLRNNCSVVSSDKIVSAAEGGKQEGSDINVKAPANPMQVTVGFTLPYAARMHEDMAASHPLGGQAKFLENTFNESVDTLNECVAAEIKKVIK